MRPEDSPPRDVAVAELAERQFGVVTLAQLRALGLGERGVRHRVRAGRLRRVHRGVYAVGHGMLDARETTRHQGIPITTVPRTLLDLAATVRADRLERALAQAQRLQLYDRCAITDVLARSNGHRGKGVLAAATSRVDPKWTRSELEARFLRLVREAGLPEPLVNATLAASDHPRLEVDLCWPTHGLIVELDGWETHRTRAAFERDRARDAALTADGWRVVRFTWHEPRATIQRRLRALLAG